MCAAPLSKQMTDATVMLRLLSGSKTSEVAADRFRVIFMVSGIALSTEHQYALHVFKKTPEAFSSWACLESVSFRIPDKMICMGQIQFIGSRMSAPPGCASRSEQNRRQRQP